jgi:hypothetical protein
MINRLALLLVRTCAHIALKILIVCDAPQMLRSMISEYPASRLSSLFLSVVLVSQSFQEFRSVSLAISGLGEIKSPGHVPFYW